MNSRDFGRFVGFGVVFSLLVLLVFIILYWLQIPAGRFLDWFIGLASFWWLLIIVTFPWNIHFQAREILAEAQTSVEQGIAIKPEQVAYVKRWAKLSLGLAVGLHLLSALGFYILAATGISVIGYLGSGVAVPLTGLRPLVRAYEYLVYRLRTIRQEIKYPREDVIKLRYEVDEILTKLKGLEKQLDSEDEQSWASQQERHWATARQGVDQLRLNLDELRLTNQSEHTRLSREAEQAIAQISVDGQFLNHVREIIRFVKAA
jgi:hypothetical protein